MKYLNSVIAGIESVIKSASLVVGAGIIAMFLIVLGDTLNRAILGFEIYGAIEITGFIVAGCGFLGLGYAQLERKHARIEFLMSRLSLKAQGVVGIFVLLILLAFFIPMTWEIGEAAYSAWEKKIYDNSAAILLPMWIPSFLGVVGCFLLVVAFLTQFLRIITGLTKDKA